MAAKKVALITGASRGIGAAAAIEFGRRGYDVAIAADDSEGLDTIAKQARNENIRAEAFVGDLAESAFVESLVPKVIAAFGRIDVLVNNAAWRELLTMRQIGRESWEKTLRICLTAPAFLAKAAAADMETRRAGVIINISSIMSQRTSGIAPAYIAAKGGLDALTYDLAALYGPSGIRVLAVNPGAIDTAMSADYPTGPNADLDRKVKDWSEQMIPLRRWGKPEEIARAIAMLASDDASYLTGTTVVVDGGWSHQFEPYDLKHEQYPEQFP